MTQRFSHDVDLAAPPEKVFAVLTDPELLAARYRASGADDVVVLEHRADGDRLEIVYRRVEAGSLPAPIAKLVRGAAVITQTDTWSAADPDGRRQARWTVETKGVAVTIGGTVDLRPSATGTTLTEAGTVSAHVPLVSGLIERLAGEQSGIKLRREWEWLRTQL